MSRYRKVIWNEGMLLSPHHFQQWDNYHEDQLSSRISSLIAYEWGLTEIKVNRDSIANGYFDLMACRGVMPDGLIVDIPQIDAPPEARQVAGQLDTAVEKLDVYLAIPAKRIGAIGYQARIGERDPGIRFLQTAGNVIDETTGENEQQLAFAQGNYRLLFGDEAREGYSTIKIAVLERNTTGQLTLSEDYIPPLLHLSASNWLANMLRQLVEILVTKSSTLGEQRRQRASSLADFTTSEVAVFWLLHTVNSSIPQFTHLLRSRLVHPERLYISMAELAGKLMTFVTDRHPKDIVRYDHNDLYTTFSRLIAEIRELLETVIPTRCVAIPLENVRESLYVGRVLDDRLLQEAKFYLAVRAQIPESRLIERVPRVIKIASRDVIDAVVGSALPGVVITHASPPPSPIPARVGFHYFGLDSIGPYWDTIRGSKSIAIYVPDEFPEVKLEFYAVKP